jgi:hypothetical protein
MSDKINTEIFEVSPKKPNFLLILILAGATLLILFVAAYLLLSDTGKKLLPGLHPDAHPTSYLLPAMPARPAARTSEDA